MAVSKIFNRNVKVEGTNTVDAEGGFAVNGTTIVTSSRGIVGASFKFSTTSGSILNSNDAEIIDLHSTAIGTPVNQVRVTNSATGSNPSVAVVGDDTNISLNLLGKGTGGVRFGSPMVSSTSTRSGAGAIPITNPTCLLTTTGANALTLADGIAGQTLTIVHVVDGGDGTLTPTTKTGYTSIVFDAVGDTVTLQFHTTYGWVIIGQNAVTVS